MVVNFLLNRNYTFASDRRGIDQARTFVVVALSGLALTTCVASLARSGWHCSAAALSLSCRRRSARRRR